MIRAAETAEDFEQLRRVAACSPGMGPRLWVDAALQQQNPAMGYQFYLVGEAAALEQTGLAGALYGTPADTDELELFFHFLRLENLATCGWRPVGWAGTEMHVLEWGGGPVLPAPPGVDARPAPSDIMAVLESTEPMAPRHRRDGFYASLCARLNHGWADALMVREQGAPAACAGMLSLAPGAAYLSSVETRPQSRGKGYASALVSMLCQKHAGRHISLICMPELVPFYGRLGFLQAVDEKGAPLMFCNAKPPKCGHHP